MTLNRFFTGTKQNHLISEDSPILNRDGLRLIVWAYAKPSNKQWKMTVLIMGDYAHQEYVFATQNINGEVVLATHVILAFKRGTISPVAEVKRLFSNTLSEEDLWFINIELQKDAVRTWTWRGDENDVEG